MALPLRCRGSTNGASLPQPRAPGALSELPAPPGPALRGAAPSLGAALALPDGRSVFTPPSLSGLQREDALGGAADLAAVETLVAVIWCQ